MNLWVELSWQPTQQDHLENRFLRIAVFVCYAVTCLHYRDRSWIIYRVLNAASRKEQYPHSS